MQGFLNPDSKQLRVVALWAQLLYKASLNKALYHRELIISVTDSTKRLSNQSFQPSTMCKALRRQNKIVPFLKMLIVP